MNSAFLRQIHLWSGILLLVPTALISASGVALIFAQEIVEARLPQLWESEMLPVGAEEIARDLHSIDALASEVGWNLVRLPDRARPYYKVWLRDGYRAYLAVGKTEFADRFAPVERPETFIHDVHVRLLGGDIGEVLVAWIGLIAVINILIGLLLWWPRRHRTRLAQLWPGSMSRGKLLRSHMTWGGLMTLPLLVVVLTGTMTAFRTATEWALVAVFGDEQPRQQLAHTSFPVSRPEWGRIVRTADEVFVDDRLIYLSPPPSGQDGAIYIRSRTKGEWHPNGRSRIYLDANTAELLAYSDARETGLGHVIAHGIYPVHSAQGSARNLWPVVLLGGLTLLSVTLLSSAACLKRLIRSG